MKQLLTVPLRIGLGLRSAAYAIGLKKPVRLAHPVVSVGNLTVAGNAKTPFVEYLCRRLLRQEFQPVILSRGYRGEFENSNRVVSNGQELLATARQAGDEPLQMARNLPGVVVAVGRRRSRSARLVEDWHPRPVFVLDDGYQHWSLARDLDLLLVDATHSLAAERLLPAGRLREPLSAAARADAVVLTRTHLAAEVGAREAELAEWTDAPCFRFGHRLASCYRLTDQTPVNLDSQPVVALSGIARGGHFQRDLQNLGAEVVDAAEFPDHHLYNRDEVEEVIDRAVADGANWVVTTEKDAVRLYEVTGLELDRLAAVALRMEPAGGSDFGEWFDRRIGELVR